MIETEASRAKWLKEHNKAVIELRSMVFGSRPVKGIGVANKMANIPGSVANKPKRDRKEYQRELMRKRRAQPEQQVPRQETTVST